MRVFLSAGEPSGDHHAAVLVQELRSRQGDVECIGLGGPRMEAAGCRLVADLTQFAVMWFLRVILSIHHFVDLARQAERSFIDSPPDVCVLVDFPGFHWWLAWRAKRHGIPVVFYCPPQIWAWASWRISKMKRLVDYVLSPLPFEHEWFLAQGMQSTLVGHPFFDEASGSSEEPHAVQLPEPASDHDHQESASGSDPAQRPLVLLLPGSRNQEISGNLGSILGAAAAIRRRVPTTRFIVAALHDHHARRIREMIAGNGEARRLGITVAAGQTRELIDRATTAIAVSGSVSLELLAARVPTVILYRIGGFAYVVQSFLRRARFITLVNLLACRQPIHRAQPVLLPPRRVPLADSEGVFPEYLAVGDPAERIATHIVEWLRDPAAIARARARVDSVAVRVAHPGSAARAAMAVAAIASGQFPTNRVGLMRRAA